MVHEVHANRVVTAGHERHLQFCPDAVRRSKPALAPGTARDSRREEAAERADVGEDARRERRARQQFDTPDRFVAGVDIDAGGLVLHLAVRRAAGAPCRPASEIQFADERLHQGPSRGAVLRLPVRPAREGKEALLVESSSSMSKPSASSAMAGSLSAPFSSMVIVSGCVAQRHSRQRQRDRRARRIFRWHSERDERLRRISVSRDTEGAEARRCARRSSWKPAFLSENFSVSTRVPLMRLAVHVKQADRSRDRRLAWHAAPYAESPRASRAPACHQSSPMPAPHRPAEDRRAWPRRISASSAYDAL